MSVIPSLICSYLNRDIFYFIKEEIDIPLDQGIYWQGKSLPYFREACEIGNLDLVKFLYKRKHHVNDMAYRPHRVFWGCNVSEVYSVTASYYGHLDILKYLVSIGFKPDEWSMLNAIRMCHLPIIKYLRKIGLAFKLTSRHINVALTGPICENRLDIIEYLYNVDPSFDRLIAELAVMTGQLKILRFLEKEGFVFKDDLLNIAIELQKYETIEFLLDKDCRISRSSRSKKIRDLLDEYGCLPRKKQKT